MLYESDHVLLAAVLLALALPEPGRWNPFAVAGYAARVFARDLPGSGRWAGLAGVLLLVLVVSPAVGIAWALVYALPVGLRVAAPEASPVVGLALAGILLRLTFWLPPVSVWARWIRSRPGRAPSLRSGQALSLSNGAAAPHLAAGAIPLEVAIPSRGRGTARSSGLAAPHEFLARCATDLAAPVLLFAFLGIHAAVIYRAALEVARALGENPDASRLAAPAAWATYIPAAPAHRLVILFSALAAPSRAAASPVDACPEAPALTTRPQQVRACAVTVAATMAVALLVTIW
jgi:hypothetical protein